MEFNKIRYILLFLMVASVVSSCSEDTGYIGVLPQNENLTTSMEYHGIYSQSLAMNSVEASSMYSYLGRIYDPETKGLISSSYATQFGILEGEKCFPAEDSILSRDPVTGRVRCDSVLLSMTFDKYYGDYNTPLKVAVYPINPKNPLSEDTVYYTDTDLEKYIDPEYRDKPLVTQVFSVYNRSHSTDPTDISSTNYPSIRIPLPTFVGDSIMHKWYRSVKDKSVTDFKDSYHFIHNVMPGYYVKITQGEGSMVRIFLDNLYVIYNAKGTTDSTSSYRGESITRFAGTPEVIQTCRYTQLDVDSLVNKDTDATWIKTPAGIMTELTLNVDSVMGRPSEARLQHWRDSLQVFELPDEYYRDSHYTDSISRIQLLLQRYNKDQSEYHFGIPQKLLLIPEAEADTFFVSGSRTADAITTYVSSFSSTYNSYEFSNIGRLYSALYRERDTKVRKLLSDEGISDPSYQEIYERTGEWMADNPNWGKCYLIPVETTTSSISTTASSSTVTSINHDLSLSSARLVRGTKETPIKIQVFYVTVNNSRDQ